MMIKIISFTLIDQIKMAYVKLSYKIKVFNIYIIKVAKGKIKIEHEYYYPKQIDINENY